jgi:hypothetical protein
MILSQTGCLAAMWQGLLKGRACCATACAADMYTICSLRATPCSLSIIIVLHGIQLKQCGLLRLSMLLCLVSVFTCLCTDPR